MARPKEFDQDTVLDKAMELFWYKGYEATSVQDLVDHMGISRGSLYDSFGDKHTLFLTVLDRYKQNSHHRFRDIFDNASSPTEAIARFFYSVADEAVADTKKRGCLMTNATVELAPHDAETADQARSNRANVENILYLALVQAQANGEISKEADARALASFLFTSIQGLRVVAKTITDRRVLESVVQVTLSVLN